jgi:hypothetical protein
MRKRVSAGSCSTSGSTSLCLRGRRQPSPSASMPRSTRQRSNKCPSLEHHQSAGRTRGGVEDRVAREARTFGRYLDGGLRRLVGLLSCCCGLAAPRVFATNFPPISTRYPLPSHSVHSIPAINPVPRHRSHGMGTFSFIGCLAENVGGDRFGLVVASTAVAGRWGLGLVF